ncbi:MAG: LOG family protein [Sedimentisphaerales bacterium]|nr:LOG family protein [Sedimentisphaerales bacterium]
MKTLFQSMKSIRQGCTSIALCIILVSVLGCTPQAVIINLPNDAWKVDGPMVANGDIPSPQQVAKDAYSAKKLIEQLAPDGVITVFGSARAQEHQQRYINTRRFAYQWTKKMGDKYPILTGGGPGIMAAANRGAREAGGKSLYIGSYFKSGKESINPYCTAGYLASSFAQREADMVDYAAAVVAAPGGIGTEWEIWETLAKIQTGKKKPCPVILLGDKKIWQTLLDRLEHLKTIGTISPKDVNLVHVAETPEAAIEILEKHFSKL